MPCKFRKIVLHQSQTDKTALRFRKIIVIVILSTCLSVIFYNYTLLYQESQYIESGVMYNLVQIDLCCADKLLSYELKEIYNPVEERLEKG